MVTVYDVTTGQTRPIEIGDSAQWSPDSKRLVYRTPSALKVWSLDSGASSGVPAAGSPEWLAGGQLALKEPIINAPGGTIAPGQPHDVDLLVRVFGPEVTPLGEFRFMSEQGLTVWLSDRLVQLSGLPWTVAAAPSSSNAYTPYVYTEAGLALEDPTRGARTTLIPPDQLLISPSSAVVLADSVLTWTRKCLGFYETVCSYQLHRVSLVDGTDKVVAVTREFTTSAISPDRRHLAIGTPDGIFVKDLP
jgi:hypothetical protein